MSDYDRVAKAIEFLQQHCDVQPKMIEIANHLNMSESHLQHLFRRWAGISPKRFLQVLTVINAKKLLRESDRSLLDIVDDLGLSGTGRLHDHFVNLEAVTPGIYKTGGEGLTICWGLADSPYGKVAAAFTERGINKLSFLDESHESWLNELEQLWPRALFSRQDKPTITLVDEIFTPGNNEHRVNLHITGTNFQIAVWRALLEIPSGACMSYSELAECVGKPAATRAVANAVGANPVAYLIPCHRVIRRSGALGGYRWGLQRKQALLAREFRFNMHDQTEDDDIV